MPRRVGPVPGYEHVLLGQMDGLSPRCAAGVLFCLRSLEDYNPDRIDRCAVGFGEETYAMFIPNCPAWRLAVTVRSELDGPFAYRHGLVPDTWQRCTEAIRVAREQFGM